MKNRWWFIPAFVVVITLLIVGSFFDLDISQAIFNDGNGASKFFAAFAMVPLMLCSSFIAGTLVKMVAKKRFDKTWQNVLLIAIAVIIFVVLTYIMGAQITSYHAYHLARYLSIPLGLIVTVPGVILGYCFLEKIDRPDIIKIYLMMGIAIIFTVASVEIIKILVPRVRYTSVRYTLELGLVDESLFRPWFNSDVSDAIKQLVKNFGSEEYKSFPSGHSNAALAMALILMYLPLFIKKLKNKEVLLFYIGFVYFLFIAFMRMYNGAHYLSDTMFSGLYALTVYFIVNEIYLRKLHIGEKV